MRKITEKPPVVVQLLQASDLEEKRLDKTKVLNYTNQHCKEIAVVNDK